MSDTERRSDHKPSIPGLGGTWAFSAAQTETLLGSLEKHWKQAEAINRAWLASIQRMSDTSLGLVRKLGSCQNPTEIWSAWNDWLWSATSAAISDAEKLGKLCTGQPAESKERPPERAAAGESEGEARIS